MKHFLKLAEGLDVSPVNAQLDAHPELWDAISDRRLVPNSPHAQMTDIWLRYRPQHELDYPWRHREPHFATWYPSASVLTAAKALCTHGLMGLVGGVYLGGILITRMQPGARLHPHTDHGSWHAEWLNTKVYVPLRGNDQCVNRCGDEAVVMRPGEIWTFDNLTTHSVENNGDTERTMLIACIRTEP